MGRHAARRADLAPVLLDHLPEMRHRRVWVVLLQRQQCAQKRQLRRASDAWGGRAKAVISWWSGE